MKYSYLPTMSSTLLLGLLSACGVTPQDGGTQNTLSGLAVDGYVSGAKVYLDISRDGVRDVYEPYALTDKDGYFGIAKDGTNYCTSSNSEHAKYCLKTGQFTGEILRIEGGFDTTTGKPFRGMLSRVADASTSQISSPLTSLAAYMTSAQVTALLSAENTATGSITTLVAADLNSDLLTIDATAGTNANQNHLIRTAWLVHKSADILSAELKRRYTDAEPTNANKALANDFTPYVYQAMAESWNGTDDIAAFLAVPANINSIVSAAQVLLATDLAVNDGGVIAADMGARINHLVTLVSDAGVFAAGGPTGLTAAQVKARGRAIEIMTRMLSQATLSGNEATAIPNLVAALGSLESNQVDLEVMLTNYLATGNDTTDFTFRPTLSSELTANALGASDGTPVQLTNGTTGETADVVMDIDPTGSGTVSIDLSADTDGDGIADPITVPGTIEPIDEYTSIMTLDILGSEQTVILTTNAAGELVIDTSTMDLEGVDLGSFTF